MAAHAHRGLLFVTLLWEIPPRLIQPVSYFHIYMLPLCRKNKCVSCPVLTLFIGSPLLPVAHIGKHYPARWFCDCSRKMRIQFLSSVLYIALKKFVLLRIRERGFHFHAQRIFPPNLLYSQSYALEHVNITCMLCLWALKMGQAKISRISGWYLELSHDEQHCM